ncbi:hypothetical protein BDR03DRAFT_986548 [Suillus americanus]|nr:hypothetical protein BDR03DRAFT_986548 [Suillus americanus]
MAHLVRLGAFVLEQAFPGCLGAQGPERHKLTAGVHGSVPRCGAVQAASDVHMMTGRPLACVCAIGEGIDICAVLQRLRVIMLVVDEDTLVTDRHYVVYFIGRLRTGRRRWPVVATIATVEHGAADKWSAHGGYVLDGDKTVTLACSPLCLRWVMLHGLWDAAVRMSELCERLEWSAYGVTPTPWSSWCCTFGDVGTVLVVLRFRCLCIICMARRRLGGAFCWECRMQGSRGSDTCRQPHDMQVSLGRDGLHVRPAALGLTERDFAGVRCLYKAFMRYIVVVQACLLETQGAGEELWHQQERFPAGVGGGRSVRAQFAGCFLPEVACLLEVLTTTLSADQLKEVMVDSHCAFGGYLAVIADAAFSPHMVAVGLCDSIFPAEWLFVFCCIRHVGHLFLGVMLNGRIYAAYASILTLHLLFYCVSSGIYAKLWITNAGSACDVIKI